MKHSIKDIFSNRPLRENNEDDLYKVRKVPCQKDDLRQLKDLLKVSSRPSRVGSKGFRHGGGFVGTGFNTGTAQRVTFKLSNGSSLKTHKKYVMTYMPQMNKDEVADKPMLFGTEDSVYNDAEVARHFKCIISPENQNVNLEVLTREFIKRMEVITGFDLYWKGCVHTDTAHRHAHVCINGRDANGRNVYFQPEMIKRTMRETLSYVATQLVGERSSQEILAAEQGLVTAKRWTKLDESLERYSGKISLQGLNPELQNRLAFLSTLQLANKFETHYQLESRWKDVLAATGRYNTFLEEYQKSGGTLELYSGGRVYGKCEREISFDRDESWNDAVIVNEGQRRVYVPVWNLRKEGLVGRLIEIRGGDRALSRQISDRDIIVADDSNRKRPRKR